LPSDSANLPEVAREVYEERAAIREYDGGLPRDEAERLAIDDMHALLSVEWAEGDRRSGALDAVAEALVRKWFRDQASKQPAGYPGKVGGAT
jgi:hypothetical protein